MEGLGELLNNWPTLLAQVINFGLLLVLLRIFAYKPVMRMLDERSRKIKESLEEAESTKEKAALAEEDIKKQLESAGKEGQERIARALRVADEMKQKAQEDAKHEAESLLNRARTEIQQERDEAIGKIHREFADITIMAAGKVIDRSLDKKAHQELIEQVLAESSGGKKKQ